jgi:predicted nucleic acid-binding Zn ribbon protein
MIATPKTCLNCGKTIKGRSDKKFCDDFCRNNYNNQIKSETGSNTFVRNVNNYLSKNRRILKEFLPDQEEMSKVHHDKLVLQGFNFKYHTHQYTNKKGQVYFFCYEYGYLPLENGWYLLVKRKD